MVLLLLSCNELPTKALPEVEPFAPAEATLRRLTEAQYRNSVEDLVGVAYTGELPVDYSLHGYTTVGASELAIPPLDLELYEAASWELATQVDPRCSGDPTCVRGVAAELGLRAWRRPLSGDELDALVGLYETVVDAGATEDVAEQAVVAAILQSPSFLFRVELGEPHPSVEGRVVLTEYELATRLSYFLVDSTPDEELLTLAAEGRLGEELETQARRLLRDERSREALTGWFGETLELERLEAVDKGAAYTDGLGQEMVEEVEVLFGDVVFDREAALAELLVTDATWTGPELAALYGVSEGWGELDPAQGRGGLLGRAAPMTLLSHSTLTSPTRRGKWVRTRMLCHSVPPPPEGVEATIDALGEEGTMRDKLEQHRDDDACRGCHQLMDPIGYAFEHFDVVGAWRPDENGLALDVTGELDGEDFEGAAELGALVAAHPDFGSCMALNLYRYGIGTAETEAELPLVEDLGRGMDRDGRLTELAVALVLSEGFREATSAEGAEVRGSDCEGLELPCEATFGPGTSTCDDGVWGDCVGPGAPEESCNSVDDDLDGLVDEGLEVFTLEMSIAELTAWHTDCSPTDDAVSGACRAASHRACSSTACAESGWGIVELDTLDSTVLVGCVADPVQAVSYADLSLQHGDCHSEDRWGPACNAAISRWCSATGQTTGYGPVENSYETAYVVCNPTATTHATTYSALSAYHSSCDGSIERIGARCGEAMDAWCLDQGALGGHGPLENYYDDVHVACLWGSE